MMSTAFCVTFFTSSTQVATVSLSSTTAASATAIHPQLSRHMAIALTPSTNCSTVFLSPAASHMRAWANNDVVISSPSMSSSSLDSHFLAVVTLDMLVRDSLSIDPVLRVLGPRVPTSTLGVFLVCYY